MVTLQEGEHHYNQERYQEAYEIFKELATNNVAEAQYLLGLMYYHGDYVEKDQDQAVIWLRRAAQRKNVDAMNLLMHIDSTVTSHTNRF